MHNRHTRKTFRNRLRNLRRLRISVQLNPGFVSVAVEDILRENLTPYWANRVQKVVNFVEVDTFTTGSIMEISIPTVLESRLFRNVNRKGNTKSFWLYSIQNETKKD